MWRGPSPSALCPLSTLCLISKPSSIKERLNLTFFFSYSPSYILRCENYFQTVRHATHLYNQGDLYIHGREEMLRSPKDLKLELLMVLKNHIAQN